MASSSTNTPVSLLIGGKSSGGDNEPQKKTREDWRKAKELEEARKAGTAPAAVDEEGKDINPHIPQYISAAPWYYNTSGPTLKHQRPQTAEKEAKIAKLDEWFHRGVDHDLPVARQARQVIFLPIETTKEGQEPLLVSTDADGVFCQLLSPALYKLEPMALETEVSLGLKLVTH